MSLSPLVLLCGLLRMEAPLCTEISEGICLPVLDLTSLSVERPSPCLYETSFGMYDQYLLKPSFNPTYFWCNLLDILFKRVQRLLNLPKVWQWRKVVSYFHCQTPTGPSIRQPGVVSLHISEINVFFRHGCLIWYPGIGFVVLPLWYFKLFNSYRFDY